MKIEPSRFLIVATSVVGIVLASRASGQETAAPYTSLGCETCHGTEGGGSAAGPRLASSALSLSDFVAYVRNPTGTMEPYSTEDVSDETLNRIYDYLASITEPVLQGRLDIGAALYRKTGCYECHADEAQGGMHGPRLGPDPVSFDMFRWYTRHPTATMPPYSTNVLSDQDLADIYAFVEARPEPPPVSSIPLLAPKD